MKISREGYRIIGITGAICFALWMWFYSIVDTDNMGHMIWFGTILFLLLWFFVVAFFRVPRRIKIHDPKLIFSPCDGRVVATEVVYEDEFFKKEMLQISVFMSITNVHVNWIPVAGVVEYFRHHHGRFLVAWHPKSSTENERTTTVIKMDNGEMVMFRQIAGYVARRIVSYMRVGHPVDQNGFAGFIKFGSRVDLLIPVDSEVLVEIGDGVVGSQTPIARFRRNK